MWYEILPSAFIIFAGLGLPGWGLYHIHNLVIGNHFRRSLGERWDRHLYQRDLRINGNPYNVVAIREWFRFTIGPGMWRCCRFQGKFLLFEQNNVWAWKQFLINPNHEPIKI